MNKNKTSQLTKRGWKVGTTSEFLNLSRDETAYIEMKLALAAQLQSSRRRKRLTQVELANLLHSSQSRVAKMERNDPTVSVDLLIKSLLALGNSPKDVARAIALAAA
jgi:predicted XRE-type DNA-binding protein